MHYKEHDSKLYVFIESLRGRSVEDVADFWLEIGKKGKEVVLVRKDYTKDLVALQNLFPQLNYEELKGSFEVAGLEHLLKNYRSLQAELQSFIEEKQKGFTLKFALGAKDYGFQGWTLGKTHITSPKNRRKLTVRAAKKLFQDYYKQKKGIYAKPRLVTSSYYQARIRDNEISIGCTNFSSVEVEALALHYGWVTQEGVLVEN